MKRLAALFVLVVLIAVPIVMAQKGNPNPGVMPPNSDAFGYTYPEWAARWWQWAESMPLDQHPLNDTVDCGYNQLGHVWFLGGAVGPNSQPVRYCTVPVGTALFFPLINVECSNLELAPFFGGTAEERKACANLIIDTVYGVEAEIDGVPLKNVAMYRVTSPDFAFLAPIDNNILFVPGGPGRMVTDGYWVLLNPLPKGNHVVHFKGFYGFFGGAMAEITYYLTVTTEKK